MRNPDGSFSYAGERYRLVERADRSDTFDVVQDTTGASIGTLTAEPRPDCEPRIETPASTEHRHVLQAIASLLGSARGAVPIQ